MKMNQANHQNTFKGEDNHLTMAKPRLVHPSSSLESSPNYIFRVYKYRIYPTRKQVNKLNFMLYLCRNLYNTALEQRINIYNHRRKSLSFFDQVNQLPQLKIDFPEYKEIYSHALTNVLRKLDFSYQAFFRRIRNGSIKSGFPKFKGKDFYNSICYPDGGFKIEKEHIILFKVGKIKARLHRPIIGEPTGCSITKDIDRWYVFFSVKIKNESIIKNEIKSKVGIDLGIKSFAYISDGTIIKNPKWFRKSERKLIREQRRLSRKIVGSNNRKKQIIKVANIHRKIKETRDDFLHKLTHSLANKYDFISIEDLQIKNMMKNRNLSKSIGDASWNKFIQYLKYKMEWQGKTIVSVSPKGTTQKCSQCGEVVKKTLKNRIHKCPVCELIIDRDYNASLNILNDGLKKYRGEHGNLRLGKDSIRKLDEPGIPSNFSEAEIL